MLENHPALRKEERYVTFLASAYRKMLRTMLTIPARQIDDYFRYMLTLVFSEYYEMPETPSYREVSILLMQRFAGQLYLRSRRTAGIMKCLCAAILETDLTFFDDIPFIREIADPAEKKDAVLRYAWDCGIFHNFGMAKMNMERLLRSRNLFEDEFEILKLHTLSGHDDLAARYSTRNFADIALGHHRWYNGAGGFPESYVRNSSEYRQMTDVAAVAAYLVDHTNGDASETMREAAAKAHRRFSPLVTSYLESRALREELSNIIEGDDRDGYRDLYDALRAEG